jgi:DNA-binding winged helix-turn-helix (wHTH) protein
MTKRAHPTAVRIYRFGDFTFDRTSHQLLQKETSIHLSRKAHKLLELLLEASPRLVSKKEIAASLWPGTFVADSSLPAIVNELRRALGEDSGHPGYIRTVYKAGYAFNGGVEREGSDAVEAAVTAVPFEAVLLQESHSHDLHEGENIVGRSRPADVVLRDSSVSRRHAMITIRHEEFWIEDLGSTNGTFVNGRQIAKSQRVESGFVLTFGTVQTKIVSVEHKTTARIGRLRT